MFEAIAATALWAGMLALGGWLAAGRAFGQPAGLARGLGAAVLAWAWATLSALGLGLAGWLAPAPLLACAAAGLACAGAARLWIPAPAPAVRADAAEPRRSEWDWPATLALGLVLWAATVIGLPAWLLPVNPHTDGPIYHLYFAARWWKAQQVFLVPAPFGETVVTYLPLNGELWFASLMSLWGGDRLARVGQVPFLLLAAAAIVAMARELRIGLAAGAVAAAWFVSCLPVLLFSFEADVDTIFTAGYLTAVYFFLRYALGSAGWGTLALGALAAGGAWGTKATGTVFVPPLLALAAVAAWRVHERQSWRGRVGHLTTLGLAPGLMCGYWFARNAWLTGNPLYPLQVALFGRVWLVGWHNASAMRFSLFYLPVSRVRYLADNLLLVADPRLAPVWAVALLGAGVGAFGRRQSRGWWICALAALAIIDLALYWLLIPYRSQQRFLLPALGVAAVPLAALLDRARGVRWAAVGLLALHLLTPQTWPFLPAGAQARWGLSRAMSSTAHGLIRIPLTGEELRAELASFSSVTYLASTLVTGLGAMAVALAWSRAARRPSARAWATGTAATVVLVAAAAWSTWVYAAEGLDYPDFPAFVRGWERLEQVAGPAGARVAYAGSNRAYYLMGRGLRNDVRYVSIDAHRDWRLHDYHRQAIARGQPNWPDPRPGWDRLNPDYDAWLANLAAERIDLLVVTRVQPQDGVFNIADREGFPIERVWADAHPEAFTLVYGSSSYDPNFRIYRVRRRPEGRVPQP